VLTLPVIILPGGGAAYHPDIILPGGGSAYPSGYHITWWSNCFVFVYILIIL